MKLYFVLFHFFFCSRSMCYALFSCAVLITGEGSGWLAPFATTFSGCQKETTQHSIIKGKYKSLFSFSLICHLFTVASLWFCKAVQLF